MLLDDLLITRNLTALYEIILRYRVLQKGRRILEHSIAICQANLGSLFI